MKKKSKILLAGLLAVSLAGASTAVAFLVSGVSLSPADTSANKADQAVYLAWGESKSVGDITNLTPTTPAYRYVSVAAPSKSSGVGTPQIKFAIATATANALTPEIYGVKIEIADKEWKEGTTAAATIDVTSKGQTTGLTAALDVTAAATYYMKVSMDATAYAEYTATTPTIELNGTITVSFGDNLVA